MKFKNLWVGNIYNCCFFGDKQVTIVEPGEHIERRILIKMNDRLYRCPSTDVLYTTDDIFGLNKVDKRSLKPLSKYFTPQYRINKSTCLACKEVRDNVKKLKKAKKI